MLRPLLLASAALIALSGCPKENESTNATPAPAATEAGTTAPDAGASGDAAASAEAPASAEGTASGH